eukprot:COSAG02_NODE_2427_length_8886_cov_8.409469_11_plen_265_part_00
MLKVCTQTNCPVQYTMSKMLLNPHRHRTLDLGRCPVALKTASIACSRMPPCLVLSPATLSREWHNMHLNTPEATHLLPHTGSTEIVEPRSCAAYGVVGCVVITRARSESQTLLKTTRGRIQSGRPADRRRQTYTYVARENAPVHEAPKLTRLVVVIASLVPLAVVAIRALGSEVGYGYGCGRTVAAGERVRLAVNCARRRRCDTWGGAAALAGDTDHIESSDGKVSLSHGCKIVSVAAAVHHRADTLACGFDHDRNVRPTCKSQ